MSNIIESHNLSKVYNPDTIPVNAVNGVNLQVEGRRIYRPCGAFGFG